MRARVGDRVLEACVPAVAAIAVVALRCNDRRGNRKQRLRAQKSSNLGEPRIGRRIAVGRAESAAERQVETGERTLLGDCDEPEVVGVYVDVVRRRHRDRRLELARQVRGSVHGLGLGRAVELCAVEPDLVVGARLWQ